MTVRVDEHGVVQGLPGGVDALPRRGDEFQVALVLLHIANVAPHDVPHSH